MSVAAVIASILNLIAGLGVFLVACTMMSTNLQSIATTKLNAAFKKAAKSKLAGVGIGAAATAVIQSSSATSVMVIGFVNAGVMPLTQAATVIFGANIGTTVTGLLVAAGLTGGYLSPSVIFAAFAGFGAFVSAFSKKETARKIGGITAGFGMLFIGISIMSGAMAGFSEHESLKKFIAAFSNPFVLILVGAALTAVVQSSSVMTSMSITMAATGLISLNQGIYITMGANVGTCATSLIAGLAGTDNAKRTAVIHLLFNVSGVILFALAGILMRACGVDYGNLFERLFPELPQLQLAAFHTFFNLITVAFMLPLTKPLVKLVVKLIPDKKSKQIKYAAK